MALVPGAIGARRGELGHANPRTTRRAPRRACMATPVSVVVRSFLIVAVIIPALLSSRVTAAATVSDNALAVAVAVTFSSPPAGPVFTLEDTVNVTYTSPFRDPILSTWCDPDSPRQETIQKAQPFSGWALVRLSRMRLDSDHGIETVDKQCWFDLRSLTDQSHSDTQSSTFKVISGRLNDDEADQNEQEKEEGEEGGNVLELRAPSARRTRPTRTTWAEGAKRKRQNSSPSIPSPTAQQTTGPSDQPIHCKADNLTVFTEPVTARHYVVLCGRDYSSDYGAMDIRSIAAETMNDCIALCAADKTGCTTVGWGDYRGQLMCFMKSSIGEPNWAPQWMVAVEDPSQVGTGAAPLGTISSNSVGGGSGSGGGSGGLSGDAKAGIGVGVALGAVLIGAGAVAVWYVEQRRQLKQRRQEIEERKLEAASGNTDGSGGGGGRSSAAPSAHPGPPTRESSYRSDRRTPPLGKTGIDNTTSTSNVDIRPPAGSIRSNASAGVGAGLDGRSNSAGPGDGHEDPSQPHLAHVAQYIQRQQQFIMDSCRQQTTTGAAEQARTRSDNEDGRAPSMPPTTTTTTLSKPERAWTGPSVASQGSEYTPAHDSLVSPWSIGGAGGGGGPASELPVREGYQGYGPEYEMPSGAEPGQPPRPHRAPGQPTPHWGREAAEQKFLLSDMAAMKVRVLRPDDRQELP